MKKGLSVLAAALLLVSVMSVTAFAHGGHGGGHRSGHRANAQPQHALCTVEGCTEPGAHQHGDDWYCSQSGRTGDYAVCTVEGCAEFGLHEHGGEYYYCQNHGTEYGCGRNRIR